MKRTVKIQFNKTNNLINIPKAMMEETGFDKETELVIENKGDKLIITKLKKRGEIIWSKNFGKHMLNY